MDILKPLLSTDTLLVLREFLEAWQVVIVVVVVAAALVVEIVLVVAAAAVSPKK